MRSLKTVYSEASFMIVEFNKLKEFSKGKVEEAQGLIRSLRAEKEELEKNLAEMKKKCEAAFEEKKAAIAEAEEKAKSSGEIDELNGQIAVMQEVIDSKESEVATLKKVVVPSANHA